MVLPVALPNKVVIPVFNAEFHELFFEPGVLCDTLTLFLSTVLENVDIRLHCVIISFFQDFPVATVHQRQCVGVTLGVVHVELPALVQDGSVS